jgi:outer membrane protein TolC
MKFKVLIVAILCTAMAGCVSISKDGGFSEVRELVEKRADVRPQWNRNTADDKAAEQAVAELLAKPLTPESAVQIGLLNNRGLQAQYAELGVSQADMVQAGLLSNPIFSGTWLLASEAIKFEQSLTFNFMSLLLLPMQQKLGATRFEQVKAKVGNTIIGFVADTQIAYYRAVAAQQVVELMRRAVTSAEAASELADKQRQAGALGARELARQQAYLADTQTQLARAKQVASTVREKLIRQQGLAKTTQLILPERLPNPPTKKPEYADIESLALSQRLDIESAKREMDVAGQAIGITNITRFINIQEIGIARLEETNELTKLGPVLAVEIPIFDFGQARSARRRTMLREAEDHLVESIVNARSEVRERQEDLQTAYDIAQRQRVAIVPLRERIVKETQFLYNGMLESIYTLLNDYREGVMAGKDYIDAQKDYWIAHAELERAAGGRLPAMADAAAAGMQQPDALTPIKSESPLLSEGRDVHQNHLKGDQQ